eukprot:1688293-Prymnesium_polylepis.1
METLSSRLGRRRHVHGEEIERRAGRQQAPWRLLDCQLASSVRAARRLHDRQLESSRRKICDSGRAEAVMAPADGRPRGACTCGEAEFSRSRPLAGQLLAVVATARVQRGGAAAGEDDLRLDCG